MRKFVITTFLSVSVCFAQNIGTVVDFSGKASLLKSHDKDAISAIQGEKIESDTSLYCPESCTLKIKFNDPIVFIKLGQNSMVNIKKENAQLQIKLHKGFVQAQVSDKNKKESFKIMTPNSELVSGYFSNVLASYTPYFSKSSIINFKGNTQVNVKGSITHLTDNTMLQIDSRQSSPNISEIQNSEHKKFLQAFHTNPKPTLNN